MGSEVVMNLQTPFRLFIVEFELTELGLTNYKKVLALTFEYLNIICKQWLAQN